MTPTARGGPLASDERPSPAQGPRDGAASEIVGNILMIGVTVLLAGALAVSLSAITVPADPVSADLVVEDGAELRVRHAGGEAIPSDGPRFILSVDGAEETRPLSDFSANISGGSESLWEIGERVCLSCQVTGTIEAVTFVAADEVILDWQRTP